MRPQLLPLVSASDPYVAMWLLGLEGALSRQSKTTETVSGIMENHHVTCAVIGTHISVMRRW